MKKRLPFSILLPALILCACSAAPSTPPAAALPPTITENAAQSASPTPSPPPAAGAPTPPSQPTALPTPTALPPAARWYWVMDETANALIAANQYGQQYRWDAPPNADPINLVGFDLGDGQMLLLDGGATLKAYLLLPEEGIQPIQLPAGLKYNPQVSQFSLELAAANERYLVFGYTDQQSKESTTSATAERGPLLLVDRNTRTARLLDTVVHRDVSTAFREARAWAHRSDDGRYLRYLQGDTQNLNLRELDLTTGEVRTMYTVAQHTTSHVLRSVQGDLWRFTRKNVIIDLNGNQLDFASDTRTFRPLRNGSGLEFALRCADNCEIKWVSPFTSQPDQTYTLPWHTYSTFVNPLLFIPTADQNLIFTGGSLSAAPAPPAILKDFPKITDSDAPVFRLAPNGGARLLGRYVQEFAYDGTPVSSDGRYMLLGAADHGSFFFYDTQQDAIIAEIPAQPNLDYFSGFTTFLNQGRIAHLIASTPNRDYVDFFLVHSDYSGTAYAWQENNVILGGCFDLLDDDALVCTLYPDPNDYLVNLVLYHPATREIRTLVENIVPLQLVR